MRPLAPQLALWSRFVLALALAGATLGASPARADGPGDGIYRRFDTDLALHLAAGGGAWLDGAEARATTLVELRARVVDAAGPFVAFQGAPDAPGVLVAGIELRPLWPALFLVNRFTGHEWLDLFLQSLSVELGVAVLPLGGPDALDAERGLGLAVGLGVDVPLVLPSRTQGAFRGLALRLMARRGDATPGYRAAPEERDLSHWTIGATLGASFGVGVRASDEPARYRVRER